MDANALLVECSSCTELFWAVGADGHQLDGEVLQLLPWCIGVPLSSNRPLEFLKLRFAIKEFHTTNLKIHKNNGYLIYFERII